VTAVHWFVPQHDVLPGSEIQPLKLGPHYRSVPRVAENRVRHGLGINRVLAGGEPLLEVAELVVWFGFHLRGLRFAVPATTSARARLGSTELDDF
jgi:hypothetical protein